MTIIELILFSFVSGTLGTLLLIFTLHHIRKFFLGDDDELS